MSEYSPTVYQEPEEEEEPIEGEFREITPPRVSRIARSIGRGLGRAAGTTGRGIGDFGKGFIETAPKLPKPTSRGAGRFAGWGAEKAFRYVTGEPKSAPRVRKARASSSRLSIQEQTTIVDYLTADYPQIFQSLWYQDITYSELVGSLRDNFPNTYWDIRDEIVKR